MLEEATPTPGGQPLTAECTGCFKPGAVWHMEREGHYCSECLRRMSLFDQAYPHLTALIGENAAHWWDTWRAVGMETHELRAAIREWADGFPGLMLEDEGTHNDPSAEAPAGPAGGADSTQRKEGS